MTTQERRQHPRQTSSIPLQVSVRHADGSESTMQCPCRDISGGGLSFLCARPIVLEIGHRIQISVLTSDSKIALDLGKGTIVWVQDEQEEPAWAGVMLDALLDEDYLQQLLMPNS